MSLEVEEFLMIRISWVLISEEVFNRTLYRLCTSDGDSSVTVLYSDY